MKELYIGIPEGESAVDSLLAIVKKEKKEKIFS
jgi:hypothetical protein